MRNLLIASFVAAAATLASVVPVQTAGFGISFGDAYFGSYNQGGPYYRHHRRHFVQYGDWPSDCYVRKIRKYDRHGNLVVRKVRLCD